MAVIHQKVFQGPKLIEITAVTDVQYTTRTFTCRPGLGSSALCHEGLVTFLESRGYPAEWIHEFELAAEEALSGACEHAPADTKVHGLVIVVSHDGIDHVSILVSNKLKRGQVADLEHLDQEYQFEDHLGDPRGHGYPIMCAIMDSVVITLVVNTLFFTVLAKEYVPVKK